MCQPSFLRGKNYNSSKNFSLVCFGNHFGAVAGAELLAQVVPVVNHGGKLYIEFGGQLLNAIPIGNEL